MVEKSKCPICLDKVNVKDGKLAEHAKRAWNNLALKLGPEYRCDGSGMVVVGMIEEKDDEV
jgi:hypothetical protein